MYGMMGGGHQGGGFGGMGAARPQMQSWLQQRPQFGGGQNFSGVAGNPQAMQAWMQQRPQFPGMGQGAGQPGIPQIGGAPGGGAMGMLGQQLGQQQRPPQFAGGPAYPGMLSRFGGMGG